MNLAEIILCVTAIAVVTTDIIVRLVIAPHRNAKFIEDLCRGFLELQPATERKGTDRPAEPTVGRREENLLRHTDTTMPSGDLSRRAEVQPSFVDRNRSLRRRAVRNPPTTTRAAHTKTIPKMRNANKHSVPNLDMFSVIFISVFFRIAAALPFS